MTWQWPNWRVSRNEIVQKYIKIKGENNQIISPRIKGNRFYDRSPVKIIGSNNRIEIAPENQFYKLELIINGSNNHISIGEGCWGSLKIIIDTDDTVVKSERTVHFAVWKAAYGKEEAD